MDDLTKKLITDVYNLIDIKKLIRFKTDLDQTKWTEQIRTLFDELHDYTIKICKTRVADYESEVIDSTNYSANYDQPKLKRSKRIDDVCCQPELCIVACDVLSDYFYESLNKGKWCDVSINERWTYGLITLYSALIKFDILNKSSEKISTEFLNDYIMKLLNRIDYGLIYSPPFIDNLLARLATQIHDYLIARISIKLDYNTRDPNIYSTNDSRTDENNKLLLQIDKSKEIPRVRMIDLDDFFLNYFLKKKPVIIESAIDDWPAIHKWVLNHLLNKAAYRLVPIEMGNRYTDDNWTQKVITFKEFVDQFIINSNDLKGYLAQYELFERIEQLSNDFSIPDYCALSNQQCDEIDESMNSADQKSKNEIEQNEDVHINGWFGPKNTISPMHQDPKDNLLSQVMGAKYIRLYSPSAPDKNYYLHDSNLLNNTSQVDVENVDRTKYPLFPDDYLETVLKPGDMLYIPKKHWHYVRSLSTSFSISFWWK